MVSQKPDSPRRSTWVRYGVAIGSVVLGWLARAGLTPVVGPTALPFIFFFPAVAMAAWYGGFGPGSFAVILSAVASDWFFIEPAHTLGVGTIGDVAALGSY